jgi:hypothetical protein
MLHCTLHFFCGLELIFLRINFCVCPWSGARRAPQIRVSTSTVIFPIGKFLNTYSAFWGMGPPLHCKVPDLAPLLSDGCTGAGAGEEAAEGCASGRTSVGRPSAVVSGAG